MSDTIDLAPIVEALTEDGDRYDLPDGRWLVLTIPHDPDYTVNDYDADGRVEWTRGQDRPASMDGAARVLMVDGYDRLWWQPPGRDMTGKGWDDATMRRQAARVRDLCEEGFFGLVVSLWENVNDSRGTPHPVEVDSASLWGMDLTWQTQDDREHQRIYIAETVGDLVAEVLA